MGGSLCFVVIFLFPFSPFFLFYFVLTSNLYLPFFPQLSESGMDVSTLGPLSSVFVSVPAILGVVILGEPITFRKMFGILLAFSAVYVLSTEDHTAEAPAPAAAVRKDEDV
jgi:drug/metabolite transporter (DMT)-like permease